MNVKQYVGRITLALAVLCTLLIPATGTAMAATKPVSAVSPAAESQTPAEAALGGASLTGPTPPEGGDVKHLAGCPVAPEYYLAMWGTGHQGLGGWQYNYWPWFGSPLDPATSLVKVHPTMRYVYCRKQGRDLWRPLAVRYCQKFVTGGMYSKSSQYHGARINYNIWDDAGKHWQPRWTMLDNDKLKQCSKWKRIPKSMRNLWWRWQDDPTYSAKVTHILGAQPDKSWQSGTHRPKPKKGGDKQVYN